MGFSGFIKGLVLVLMASSFVRPLMADPRANVVGFFCNSSQAANATLRASFAVLSLSNQSAGIDENGLGITVSGEGPNAVFGLAQCYKDLSVTDCKLCYSEIRNHITKCFPRIGGRVFLDGCFSRTGNYSFFNEGIDSVNLKNCSSSKNHSQPDKLNQVLRKVIGSVSLAKKRTKGFAVASHSISNLTVYALVQCWETLDENTCNSCIQVAASLIMLCSPSVEGRSLHASCYMRYSTELFWNLNPTPPRSSGTQKILWIILGAAIGGFLVLTGIGFWIANRYFCRSYGNSSEDLYGSILPASIYQSKLNFSHKELRRATKNFDSSNKLGQGSYGSVYKGVLPNGREVAVKRLFLNTRQWVDQFFNEVNLINQVRHKNLVKLLGCSVSGPESLLVYKYYFNRSLDHFIFEFIRGAILIFMASSFFRPLMADPRTNVAAVACGSVQAVSPATFATNAVIAMNNEISLVYQNGFGTTSAGEAPNTLFGLAQCYRDLSSTDCKLCYNDLQSIIGTCFPKTGGRVFLDGCFARYENFSFFNQGIDSVIFKNCSSSKNHSQLHKLNRVLKKVIGTVSLASRRIKGFAVASDSISSLTIYALSQCWESLDEKTCTSCLQAAASSIMSCSPSVEGRSLNAGCYMRYSTELFWNLNQTTTTRLPGTHKRLLIILGSALVGFLALTVIGFWKAKGYLGRAYRKSLKDSHGSGLSTSTYLSKLNFRYKELERATNNFDSSNKLGQGSYGSVYKGVLPNGREVAVKRLFLSTTQWVDQFFNEVNMINQLRHKNLVKLLGCSVDGPESLLVFKYYFNKSLDHFIFGDENQAKLLDWQKRVDIIQGVADGLSYLHEESEIRVIHRDIKASNILLDDKFKPKITDFGLARSFTEDQTHISTGIAGTLGYMAPEYVVHGHLTEKADVYSFGVLILEIMTGQRCNNGFGAKPGQIFLAKIWSHYKARTINKIIDGSFYEDAMEDDMLHVVHVGLLCTQATPCYRPTMAKVAELLRNCGDRNDIFLTEPPFLDVIAMEIQEEGEGSHLLLASSFSGSS